MGVHVETELGSSVSFGCGPLITDPQVLRERQERRVLVPEWLVLA
jgi:hypothetical protein